MSKLEVVETGAVEIEVRLRFLFELRLGADAGDWWGAPIMPLNKQDFTVLRVMCRYLPISFAARSGQFLSSGKAKLLVHQIYY